MMLPLASTPEFHAVFAADLEALHGRVAEALQTLCAEPGDETAQRVLHNALHGLKGLAGIAGSRPSEEHVALLDRLATAAADLARQGDSGRAAAVFAFCRDSGDGLRTLSADATESHRQEAEAAARHLREAAQREWSDLLSGDPGAGANGGGLAEERFTSIG